MPFLAAALPYIIAGSAIASTAVSIYAATRTPKAPTMPGPSATEQSRLALEAAYAQAENLRHRRGASSTILTGPLGVTEPAQTVKSQLGG